MSTSRSPDPARGPRLGHAVLPMAALLALALGACSGSGDASGSGEWAGTTRDSAGIAIVENPSEGTWTDADRWTLTEELRIGTNEGEAGLQFGAISGIAALPDGRIGVLDGQAQEFRLFSPEGAHLRTIGRAGSGPGEFGVGAGPVLVAAGDTLLIPDLMNQRLNRYAPDGSPLGSVPMTFEGSGLPMAWRDQADGGVVTQLRPFSIPGSSAAAETSPNDVLVLRGADGVIRDTLMVFESGGTLDFSSGGGAATIFAPEPVWALSGDRIVFGISNDFRLRLYGEDGTIERVFTMPFTLQEVTVEDQEALLGVMVAIWEDFGLPAQAIEVAKQAIHFAETYPAFSQIRGGPGGTIWIQDVATLGELAEGDLANFAQSPVGSPIWRVFDSEGVLLGEVRMPDRFQPHRFDGDRIYGVQRDELDVQYAVVLRVNRPS